MHWGEILRTRSRNDPTSIAVAKGNLKDFGAKWTAHHWKTINGAVHEGTFLSHFRQLLFRWLQKEIDSADENGPLQATTFRARAVLKPDTF